MRKAMILTMLVVVVVMGYIGYVKHPVNNEISTLEGTDYDYTTLCNGIKTFVKGDVTLGQVPIDYKKSELEEMGYNPVIADFRPVTKEITEKEDGTLTTVIIPIQVIRPYFENKDEGISYRDVMFMESTQKVKYINKTGRYIEVKSIVIKTAEGYTRVDNKNLTNSRVNSKEYAMEMQSLDSGMKKDAEAEISIHSITSLFKIQTSNSMQSGVNELGIIEIIFE